jgi:hypothetical protein
VHVNEQWFVVANGEIVKVGSQYDHTGPMPKHLILLVSGDTGLPAAPQQDPPEPKTYGMAEDPHRPGYGPPSRSQGV